MVFVDGKVAIVTGGCSGIGFSIVRYFLENKVEAVTVVDNNPNGSEIVANLAKEYRPIGVKFIQADVSIKDEFARAFQETVEAFKHVDILINSAGIFNDATWEKEIAINLNGTINGCLLALDEYMPKYTSNQGGVIINLSSTAGLEGYPNAPVYSSTKHAIIGLGRAWGHEKHFKETNVRVITICPNATKTPLLDGLSGRNLGPRYERLLQELDLPEIQTADYVAEVVINLINNAESGSIWLIEAGKNCEIKLHDIAGLRNF